MLTNVPLVMVLIISTLVTIARAGTLPSPSEFTRTSGLPSTSLTVIEPHESRPGRPVEIAYRAFPAPALLSAVLGADWDAKADDIAFRARDGYVSRIAIAPLKSGKAWLAFARADGSPFTLDNLDQGETNVPLGPYYVIWDNRADSDWAEKESTDWPYQVASVTYAPPETALRPPGFDPAFEPGLDKAQVRCLTCHSVNGYGGEKAPGDLAAIARGLPRTVFLQWVLTPAKAEPATTMPPMSPNLPEDDRQADARAIYDYLSHVPPISR
jgi:mono/diheme cytochrome c family protein